MLNYSVIEISGKDALTFLNSLTTNHIQENSNSIMYSCLLTPNGRFMFDFFLIQESKHYIITNEGFSDDLIAYLTMYKLSSNITFHKTDLNVHWNKNSGKFQDPRHSGLGFYEIKVEEHPSNDKQYHINRISLQIADGFYDLVQKESVILDFGFDSLNAISYTKGCYLGQELIARSHHTGVIRKKIYRLECISTTEKGTVILQNEIKVGKVLGGVDGHYLAQIRFEKADFFQKFTICDADVSIKIM